MKNLSRSSLAAAGLLGLAGLATVALPHTFAAPLQEPAAPAAAPDAKQDMEAVRAVLQQALDAYSRVQGMTFKASSRVISGGKERGSVVADVALQRPGRARIIAKRGDTTLTAVSDGTNVYTLTSANTASYVKSPLSKPSDEAIAQALSRANVSATPFLTMFFGNPKMLLSVFEGQTKPKTTVLPEETVGGVAVRVVRLRFESAGRPATEYTLSFGKDDHLLRRAMMASGEGAKRTEITDEYTDMKVNPATLAADTFTFTAPAGMVAKAPERPTFFDPALKVGAAPFPLTGADLAGKPVSLAAYKGKVVLIDFWATWCGPCIAEMPNVIAAYNKYRGQGFDIVSISLDQEGDRAKLVDYITKNKMPWPQIYDGKGWEAENAKRYGVRAIPFTLLIGRDGKIAGVNLRGEALAPAVEAALKRKVAAAK